ncbi:MAG: glutamate--tRNA ligase [Clostridia bacterium]|nr:glutamate--tRNA ligase [Clostridia bacterium]
MAASTVRTRYAPSPTGMMHVGNLRTALFEYLIAKSMGGTFVLRIEDTDQERYVEGAEKFVYETLAKAGLAHDEGPDIGGPYAPYVQSQRRSIYRPYAERLVAEGKAYRCFCSRERLESLRAGQDPGSQGYDRHCRDLPPEEVDRLLSAGTPHVIRQKMPLDGATVFHDAVYGSIRVENKELEDQVLLKSDGLPTYNFANVIDDHEMAITHVVRGSEYLSSAPKYNLLYEALGWEVPVYVHLPLIVGRNADGTVSKLSKRHGATSFDDLVREGYLTEAIINYIALLGWAPGDTREFFTLPELVEHFRINGISKSPAIFDYAKLAWFNAEYLRAMSPERFLEEAGRYLDEGLGGRPFDRALLASILQPRVDRLAAIPEMVSFLRELPEYDISLYDHKKMKTDAAVSLETLLAALPVLESIADWSVPALHDALVSLAEHRGVKNGQVLWPIRIAVSGIPVTPGGAVEILALLGREESLRRIRTGVEKLRPCTQR